MLQTREINWPALKLIQQTTNSELQNHAGQADIRFSKEGIKGSAPERCLRRSFSWTKTREVSPQDSSCLYSGYSVTSLHPFHQTLSECNTALILLRLWQLYSLLLQKYPLKVSNHVNFTLIPCNTFIFITLLPITLLRTMTLNILTQN